MMYQILAMLILAIFYTFYFAKIIILKQQSIKTNQMGIGKKPKEVLHIERIMGFATVLTAIFDIGSIFLVKQFPANGIYNWSRNPAFVGFDLLFLSICLMYFNILLVCVSVWAAVMLHLQILQEETHMYHMFGDEYVQYTKQTLRYFGKKRSDTKERLP